LIPATAVIFDPSSPTGIGMVPIGQSSGLLAREIDRRVTNDRYTLSLNVQYRLTRRTSLFARLYWIDQTTEDVFVGARNATRFDAVIGVRYYLDPIQLPL
jgi:predicted porin